MANIGARVVDHLGWVDPIPRLDRDLAALVAAFLLNTPAIGVSALSAGFVDRFGVSDSEGALALRERLAGGMRVFRVQESADHLKRTLEGAGLKEGEFWLGGEFVCMMKSPRADQVSALAQARRDAGGPLAKQRGDVTAQNLNWLNSFFKHLRNSIAHGQLARKDAPGGLVWAFQDSNQDDNVSARIVASAERVESWVTLVHQLENVAN